MNCPTGSQASEQLYIIGHRNPDSDSICSAIAYAELKQKLGCQAVPFRLGEINRETRFILDYFQVECPAMIHSVKTQVQDLDMDQISCVSEDISVKTAWNIMKSNNVKVLPVADDNARFSGMVTLSDITGRYMDALADNNSFLNRIPLKNLVETLSARLISESTAFDTRQMISGKIVIAALTPDEMTPYIETGDILIAGNRQDSQAQAICLGAGCLIITCSAQVDDEILELATKKQCLVLVTPYDTYTTARLINQSIPVSSVMTRCNIIRFASADLIDDIKEKMLKTRFRSYPVIDAGEQLQGFISRYHLMTQHKKKVILVDHNEAAQTVDGIEQAEVIEIIDHHRIGGSLHTTSPIVFNNQPVGSTATIIANKYFDHGIRPARPISGILCAAILSDTLKFKSPTCSHADASMARRLAQLAGIDLDEFALEMFKEATTLQGKSVQDILFQDFKQFKIGPMFVGIGQVNTSDQLGWERIRDTLAECMEKTCQDQKFDLMLLLVTDILCEGSEILFVGKECQLIGQAFGVQTDKNHVYLPGILSRKMQVLPSISKAIENAGL